MMAQICNCELGFEDGHITGYHADLGRLDVVFEFWNEQVGTLEFGGLVAVHDNGAIGVTVGSVSEVPSSELLSALVVRNFDVPPETIPWRHFRFLDLDGGAMFEVVAEACFFNRPHAPPGKT